MAALPSGALATALQALANLGDGLLYFSDQSGKSRVTGDCYARICGSPGGEIPPGDPATKTGWTSTTLR